MVFKKMLSYIAFWKKREKTDNLNLRMMHGMNRISILMFLFCLVVIAIRFFTR